MRVPLHRRAILLHRLRRAIPAVNAAVQPVQVDEAADGVVPQVPAAAAARGELRRRPLALLPVELRTRLPAARAEQLRDNYENGSHQREPFFIVSRINGTCAIHEKIMPA